MGEREAFRVGFTTGVVPDKWRRTWAERVRGRRLELIPSSLLAGEPLVADLRAGVLEMAFVREPFDRDGLHLIPLYVEDPVIVVGREHPVSAYDAFAVADLAEEYDVATEQPSLTLKQQVEVVASGTGYLVLPTSVARVHARKDVAAVPALDGPTSQVGLTWLTDLEDEHVETFIGIVRGRTARSSRG